MTKEVQQLMEEWKLLRYDELPDFPLYIDQLIYVTETQTTPLGIVKGHGELTPSMVNNYVKSGVLPSPEKKKYMKKHIAILTVIAFFKNLYTLQEVHEGIRLSLLKKSHHEAYDEFCCLVESAIKSYFLEEERTTKIKNKVLFYACESLASKLYVQCSLEKMIQENG